MEEKPFSLKFIGQNYITLVDIIQESKMAIGTIIVGSEIDNMNGNPVFQIVVLGLSGQYNGINVITRQLGIPFHFVENIRPQISGILESNTT